MPEEVDEMFRVLKYGRAQGSHKWIMRRHYMLNLSPIHLPTPIDNGWARLTSPGQLLIRTGYAWNGMSGPVFDTPDNARAGLVHDALYQLIRQGYWPASLKHSTRLYADREMRRILLLDGEETWKADTIYYGVRLFGGWFV